MEWYYASNGQQNGPVSQEQLISLFQSGEVTAADLVWNESMTDWVAYGSIPELNPSPISTEAGGSSETPPPMDSSPVEAPVLAPAATATAGTVTPSGEKIPTYLWQSIVLLILCCLPAAVVALVYAVKVEPAVQSGDIEAARDASSKAKMWCWIAFGLGLVANIVIFGLGMVGAISEGM